MALIVRLKDFINEMEMTGDEISVYMNTQTGEFVTLSDEELGAAEEGAPLEKFPEWQREVIQKAGEVLGSEDYKKLPSQFDIHEYAIMQNFCYSIEYEGLRQMMLDSIHGRRAFRRFKEAIYEHGLKTEWYAYRYQAFKEIAIDWLKRYGVAYTDENGEAGNSP
jgi:hypothetical protein